MSAKRTIRDVDWTGKRALVRVDFNVPFEHGTSVISDDVRIREALPTLNYLRGAGAAVVIATHLGRPGGERRPEFELSPIAERLAQLLGANVSYVHDAIGSNAREQAERLGPGEVLLLENIRFYPGEEANSEVFAIALSRLGNVFVNDAFGTAHRAHASTEGVTHHMPAVAGLLMERELAFLGGVLESPERPFGAISGGAKVSDKVKVLERLLDNADAMFIGGGMAATFFKAKELDVGASLVEEELVGFCGGLLERAEQGGTVLHLPTDVVVAREIAEGVPHEVAAPDAIPPDSMVLDIGPETAQAWASEVARLRTAVWNGPLGVAEVPPFDHGSRAIAQALVDSGATTIIGGGSTAEAVAAFGLADRMTHVSTGGGASLEFLGGTVLPGVAALEDKQP